MLPENSQPMKMNHQMKVSEDDIRIFKNIVEAIKKGTQNLETALEFKRRPVRVKELL